MRTSCASALSLDAAVLVSIALQHGVPLEEMRSAMANGENARPHSIIGSTLDLLVGEFELGGRDLIVVKSPHTEFHMYDQWVEKNFNVDAPGRRSSAPCSPCVSASRTPA